MGTIPKDPKRCTSCKEEKPRTAFSKHAVAKGGVQSYCKVCAAAKGRERNAADPQKLAVRNRRAKLMRAYGISLEAYDEMLAKQGGACAICQTTSPTGRSGAFGPVFQVDHCHASGAIRGLLCTRCNTALGSFRDDVNLLARATAYIEGARP